MATLTRKSFELKAKAEKSYQAGKAYLAKLGDDHVLTDVERLEVEKFGAEMEDYLLKAKFAEKGEQAEIGNAAGRADMGSFIEVDEQNGKNAKAVKVFPTIGHQMAAIVAMKTRRPMPGESLEETENKLHAAATGMGEVIDSDGGYALQPDFVAEIEKRMFTMGSILALLQPVTLTTLANRLVERFIDETSRVNGSRWGSVLGYWLDEADSLTASKIKFEKMETELEKLGALGYATNELLTDFGAMAGLFTQAFAEELTFLTEDAVFEGDGIGKPLGIISSSPGCKIAVSKLTNQSAATIVSSNLSQMWQRMPTRSKGQAVWLINTECQPQLDELSLPVGTGALEPRFVQWGPDGIMRIKGRPVIEIEYANALGTEGDIVLADFSQYRFISKGGVQQAQSMHVQFLTDQTAFRAIYRVGGQPKWKAPMTPFKGTKTLSPFITLATRS